MSRRALMAFCVIIVLLVGHVWAQDVGRSNPVPLELRNALRSVVDEGLNNPFPMPTIPGLTESEIEYARQTRNESWRGETPRFMPPYCPDCSTEAGPVQAPMLDWSDYPCPASPFDTSFDSFNVLFPQRTIGVLTFRNPETGLRWACSAALVRPKIILTAGHCVGANGVWYEDYRFYPGFQNGYMPYGSLGWEYVRTSYEWFREGKYSRDYAWIELSQPIGESIGYLGFAANQNPNQLWTQYGYPVLPSPPFDGMWLVKNISSLGYLFPVEFRPEMGYPKPMAVGSRMREGSSGGPWYIGNHYANGLNSFMPADGNCDYTVFSPYFDNETWTSFLSVVEYVEGRLPVPAGVVAFVTRFYQQCLGRNPDQAGLNYWVAQLTSGTRTGADIARGFIHSQEFQNRQTSNAQYVTILYRAFFGREPDSGGYSTWVAGLNNWIMTRDDVLEGFLHSQEFINLCNAYGIIPF